MHFVVPVIFSMIVCILIWLVVKPIIRDFGALVGMVVTEEVPEFKSSLNSIYHKPEASEDAGSLEFSEPVTKEVDADSEVINISDITYPSEGTCYGWLTCEKAGLDAPVYRGDSDEILRYGAGQFVNSFLPGFGRMILIAGHASTFFAELQYVEVGDVIIFDTNYERY